MQKINRLRHAGTIQLFLLLSITLCGFRPLRHNERKTILYWANLLVNHISYQNTGYRHKETVVTWAGDNARQFFQSYTDCSGLITALLKQTYHFDEAIFQMWLGRTHPLAYQYFDAIEKRDHFKKLDRVAAIKPGDLLVIKYTDRPEHDDNTGHCMLVASEPKLRCPHPADKAQLVQFEVLVIDASRSPHGKTDTRYLDKDNQYSGTGSGVFRLYADRDGVLKGYSWSTGNPKPGFDPIENPIIAGRFDFETDEVSPDQ